MVNDEPDQHQRRLQDKFDTAIALVVDTFLEAGLHTAWMRETLKRQLEWAEEATRSDDRQQR
jgi:hypothetical protein